MEKIENTSNRLELNTKKTDLINRKSNRNSFKNNHAHPNKKKVLLNQLEFYFSDINLLNDKFLRNLLNTDSDKGVPISKILTFNKIKNMLSDIEEDHYKSNFIKKAVDSSKKIKVVNDKITRKDLFEVSNINSDDVDNKTIYVENIPNDSTHDTIYQIFNKHGRVLHVSLPKFRETKQPKGFCFVIFSNSEEANRAREDSNNSIPREFLMKVHNNGIEPLCVMMKKEWLKKKEEFKELRKELISKNKDLFASCFPQDSESINNLKSGTLVKLYDLPRKINKFDIKTWISNFAEPAYVDYDKNKNECVVRFSEQIIALNFLTQINKEGSFLFHGKKISTEPIKDDEEKLYFNKVEKLKEDIKNKKIKKKK